MFIRQVVKYTKLPLRVNLRNFATGSHHSREVVVHHVVESDPSIVVLGLNRPEARNALGRKLAGELERALEDIKYDSKTRVVILKSMIPGIFCAGADLKERSQMSPSEVKIYVCKLQSIASMIENMPMPVIAALDGVALGGGLELALACDIRTASSNAKVGLVETRLGILPGAGGTQRLPRIAGPSVAKELIFAAKVLNGFEAHKLGIVNHVVQQNETEDAAYKKAVAIAQEIALNGPVAVRMAKVAINKGLEVDLNTGYIIEQACYAQVLPTKDRQEGLASYIEKRNPIFTGE